MTKPERLVTNRLIEGLANPERERLLERCELVELGSGEVLCARGECYSHAWFPVTAFISVVASVPGHPPMEISMIGHDGMLGVTLLLAVDQAPHQAIVKGSGSAFRISKTTFCNLLSGSPALLQGLQRYCFRLMVQMGQTTACTRFHLVETRLARWLLMVDEQTSSDQLFLTHQSLADTLGVRRSAVTIASGILKQDGLISYSRGRIRILDRHGLESVACECSAAGQFTITDWTE